MRFSIEENGYNKAEVNKLIDDVIVQTEGIIERVKKQSKEIKELKEELEKYKRMEDTLKSSMYKAEVASNNIKKQAIDEGKMIVEDAKRNASRIVNDALIRSEKIELKADTLERNVRIFKKKLKLIVEQQLAVVDEIEELDLE
ncbi:MAG: DivIVA domain-containing protein [Bacilli bacterium]|nr:DivIVA domain-containing protein [Clostridium sp.]MDY6015967.1 DivIVA domain-containing protein [Bacilli bacterium]CCZ59077.1 divIVA domain protein [Clostridium sp. CAG:710]